MAANSAKKKFEKFITPRCVFAYPRLNEPDTKFKAEGEYSVKGRFNLDAPGVKELVKKVREHHAAGLVAAKAELTEKAKAEADPRKKKKLADALAKVELGGDPVKPMVNEDGTESAEFVEINFKMPAKSKKDGVMVDRSPTLQDGMERTIDPKKVAIWSGTEGKVAGFFFPYYNAATNSAGVSMRMSAVQVLKLVSKGQQNFGFGKDEDGYVADESSPFSDEPSTTTPSETTAPAGNATSGVEF